MKLRKINKNKTYKIDIDFFLKIFSKFFLFLIGILINLLTLVSVFFYFSIYGICSIIYKSYFKNYILLALVFKK